jgi:hypothetical protein
MSIESQHCPFCGANHAMTSAGMTDDDIIAIVEKHFDHDYPDGQRIMNLSRQLVQAAAPQWISVDERLPDEGQHVAFVVQADKGSIQEHINGRVLGGQFVMVCGHPTFTVPGLGFRASHWMPLPAAPKDSA